MGEKRSCHACHGTHLDPFFEVQGIPIHSCLLMHAEDEARNLERRDLELAICRDCGFVQNTLFDPTVHNYSIDYEETQAFSGTFNAFAKDLAQTWIDRHDIRNKRILEIGCGKGEFLVLMCELGNNEGIGIDPGYRPERTKTDANVSFLNEFYSEAHGELEADVILCRHTLEHIQPVDEFLAIIRRSIGERRDVKVLFELPAIERVLEDQAFWDIYYEHCSYFSLGSLSRLFRRNAFDVTHLSKAYGDQYLLLDAVPSAENTTQSLAREDDLGYLLKMAEQFRERVPGQLQQWQEAFEKGHGLGQKIVLWGSGSKAVAFITTLGLQDEIEYVVDINPHKWGRFMPGTGHEIVAPAFLEEYQPDRVVIMNAIYEEEIRVDLERLGLTPELITV